MSDISLDNESLGTFITAIFVDGANAGARFGFNDPKYEERKKEVVDSALKRLKGKAETMHTAKKPSPSMAWVEDGVLFCAFRYALGRRTYVVREVCEAIKQNVSSIQRKLCDQMIQEISEAVHTNQAGDDMDVQQWIRCREVLQQSLREGTAHEPAR